MAHPFASKQEMHPGRKTAEARVKNYARGGVSFGVSGGAKAPAKKASGGAAEFKVGGSVSAPRADKFARGGKAKSKGKGNTHINIAVVAPQKGDKPDMPPGLPPGLPPGPPPGMPPGAGPGGPPPPPGMPPGMMKRGGKVAMKGGGDSGVGRLDKVKAYGARAKKG